MKKSLTWVACIAALAIGCDESSSDDDGGTRRDGSMMTTRDAGGNRTDSGTPRDSGRPGVDAGPRDSGTTPGVAGGMICEEDTLIILAVDPGTSITVFNPTNQAVAVNGSAFQFCQRPAYVTLASSMPGATIPAGGSVAFPWPGGFTDTNAGGEVALYNSNSFGSAAALIDFVCWGTGRGMSRRSVAEMDGDWTGACAGAITGASLNRIPNSAGGNAASFDPTGAAALNITCN